jgi:nicotinic acid mononucleotide adenylyltransferase
MPKLVIFGFSANPPANHHLAIVQELLKIFEKIIVIPRGTDQNKLSTTATTHNQRKDMVNLMFSDLPNIEIDFSDLDGNIFTPTMD